MAKLQEVFDRIQEAKKEVRDISEAYRDALANDERYKKITEEIRDLRIKKQQIEARIKSEGFSKMDKIKAEIIGDNQLLSDIALSQLMKGEKVEALDKKDNKYEPIFNVKFKKAEQN